MRVVRKGLLGVACALFLRCAIRAPSLQTVALQKWSVAIGTARSPRALLSLDFARPIVSLHVQERSTRQALFSGDHEVTTCERVTIGQDDSVNISCCVASVELTSSVRMILSTRNTMRTSERHKEASWRRGFTWRF